MLGDLGDGGESPAEVRWVRDVERSHGLPVAVRQQPTGDGGRRDNVYEEFGLVVEVDGRLGHEGWDGRRRDGRRDRRAARSGRLTVRVFWDELVQSPCDLAVEVGELLRVRDGPGRRSPADAGPAASGPAGLTAECGGSPPPEGR